MGAAMNKQLERGDTWHKGQMTVNIHSVYCGWVYYGLYDKENGDPAKHYCVGLYRKTARDFSVLMKQATTPENPNEHNTRAMG